MLAVDLALFLFAVTQLHHLVENKNMVKGKAGSRDSSESKAKKRLPLKR
jgi:hypothetical protein